MLVITKKILSRLLNLGLDESGNDLNQKRIVNFYYLTFFFLCSLMVLVFLFREVSSVVLFSFICLLVSLLGLRLNMLSYTYQALVLMPVLGMTQILFSSLLFFGMESDFHWFLASMLVYIFTAFRVNQNAIKYFFAVLAVLLFLVCEFWEGRSAVYLTPQDQKIVSVSTFLMNAFSFFVVIHLVISRLRELNANLRFLSEVDELTGLSNRRKVLSDAESIFSESIDTRQPCVFSIVDLDHFKKINDTFGHDAGDLVLKRVANEMSSSIRPLDKIGRYGGEEFIIIMPNTSLSQAEIVMESVRSAIENMLIETDQGIIVPVTISAGLASIEREVSRYEEIVAQADKGLYEAKRHGRNRISVQPGSLN